MQPVEFKREISIIALAVIGTIANHLGRKGYAFDAARFAEESSTDIYQFVTEAMIFGADIYITEEPALVAEYSNVAPLFSVEAIA